MERAFYTIGIPPEFGEHFLPPSILAGHLGLSMVDGTLVSHSCRVIPCLCALPMGWSWAWHLCQAVPRTSLRAAGFDNPQLIEDGKTGVASPSPQDLASANYVDSFVISGGFRRYADAACPRVATHLRARGLTIHAEQSAGDDREFLGLHFYDQCRRWRLSSGSR